MSRWEKFGFPGLSGVPAYLPYAGIWLAYLERKSISAGFYVDPNDVDSKYIRQDYRTISEYLDDVESGVVMKSMTQWCNEKLDKDSASSNWSRPPNLPTYYGYGYEAFAPIPAKKVDYYGKGLLDYYHEYGFISRMVAELGTDFSVDMETEASTASWTQNWHFYIGLQTLGLGKFCEKKYPEDRVSRPDEIKANSIFRTQGEMFMLYYKLLNSMRYIMRGTGNFFKKSRSGTGDNFETAVSNMKASQWAEMKSDFVSLASFGSNSSAEQTWLVDSNVHYDDTHILGREPDYVAYVSERSVSRYEEYYDLGTIYSAARQFHLKSNGVTLEKEPPAPVKHIPSEHEYKVCVGPKLTFLHGVYDCKDDLQFFDAQDDSNDDKKEYTPLYNTQVIGSVLSDIRRNGIIKL